MRIKLTSALLAIAIVLSSWTTSLMTVLADETFEKTVYPIEDTRISNMANATYPEQNAATNASVTILDTVVVGNYDIYGEDGAVTKGPLKRVVYYKFNLGSIKNRILSAKFHYYYRNLLATPITAQFRTISNDWTDTEVNWFNRMTLGDTFVESGNLATTTTEFAEALEVDMTDYINGKMEESKTISFAMESLAGSTGLKTYSVEYSDVSKRPYLELVFEGNEYDEKYYGKSTIKASDSVYTSTNPSEITSGKETMRMGFNKSTDYNKFLVPGYYIRNCYLKFDISQIDSEVLNASLKYYLYFMGNRKSTQMKYYKLDADNWNNKSGWVDLPDMLVDNNGDYTSATNYIAKSSLANMNQLVPILEPNDINVTSAVNEEFNGDKTLTIGIRDELGGDHATIYPDTNDLYCPYIEVLYAKLVISDPAFSDNTLKASTNYTVSFTASNTFTSDKKADLVLLLFDENNTLVDLQYTPNTIGSDQCDEIFTANYTTPSSIKDGYKLKAYVVNGLFDMKLVSECVQIQYSL